MENVNKINVKLFDLEEVKKYFFDKKLKNVILFSQARSGSTFVSNILSEELGLKENFFPEEFFVNKHFAYLKRFVNKHDNFYLNTNEFFYKRTLLKKEKTLHIYLHRNHLDILESYNRAKEKGFYLGWEEFYLRYKPLFPELKHINPITLFNHKVWENQIKHFEHALTLSYESFNNHKKFINKETRIKKITSLKKIDKDNEYVGLFSRGWENFYSKYSKNKINFNIIEKIYFKFRRLAESRKKYIKNY
jgi:hypothetical protein